MHKISTDFMHKFLLLIIHLFITISCQPTGHDYARQFLELDEAIEQQPAYVLDSLKKIKINRLQKADKAYYFLLHAIANDKNLTHSSQDSTLQFSKEYYESTLDHYNLARTLYYLSKHAQRLNKIEIAYDLLKQAELNLKKDTQSHPHLEGLIFYQLACLQNRQSNLTEAEYYSGKALQNFSIARDTVSAVHSLKLLGQIATNKKQFSEARAFLTHGLDLLNDLEETDKPKVNEVKTGLLNSLSILYRNMSDLQNALKYARKCITLSSENDPETLSSYYHSIILAFLEQNQLDSTKHYCSLMIRTSPKGKKFTNTINGYKLLAQIAQKEGNYREACSYWHQFNIYKDSLNEQTDKNLSIELDKIYNLTEKERQLLQSENTKLRLYILVTITIILSLIFTPLYHRHRKLKTDYKQLSETVKHTEWGFSVTKELIAANNLVYDELEHILNRYRAGNVNSEIYNRFQDAFIRQKANYSSRLIAILTDFDQTFIKKFQKMFPQFSSDDTLMAAMVRHHWKVTDIAAVFHVSSEAIRKRKSRLAKKISTILKTDITLDKYLNDL